MLVIVVFGRGVDTGSEELRSWYVNPKFNVKFSGLNGGFHIICTHVVLVLSSDTLGGPTGAKINARIGPPYETML